MFSFRLVKMKAHWRDPRIQLRHPAFTHVLCVQTGSIGSSSTSSDSPADLEVGNWKILERLQTAASQTVPLSASFKVPYKRSPSFSFFLFFPLNAVGHWDAWGVSVLIQSASTHAEMSLQEVLYRSTSWQIQFGQERATEHVPQAPSLDCKQPAREIARAQERRERGGGGGRRRMGGG